MEPSETEARQVRLRQRNIGTAVIYMSRTLHRTVHPSVMLCGCTAACMCQVRYLIVKTLTVGIILHQHLVVHDLQISGLWSCCITGILGPESQLTVFCITLLQPLLGSSFMPSAFGAASVPVIWVPMLQARNGVVASEGNSVASEVSECVCVFVCAWSLTVSYWINLTGFRRVQC